MNRAFENWLQTKDGVGCNSPLTGKQQPFLKNRLWWAYRAGWENAGISAEIEYLQNQLKEANEELYRAKKLIKQLTRKKRTTP